MLEKIKRIPVAVRLLLRTGIICAAVVIAVNPVSCRLSEEGIVVIDDNYACPKLESYSVTGEKSARLVFDKKVTLKEYSLRPEIPVMSVNMESGAEDALCFADIIFENALETGKEYVLYGEVRDKAGNSLTFSLPLIGFNPMIPQLEITEVHPRYASGSNASGKYFKCEYVELRMLSPGNLSGLELFSAYDGDSKKYVFPPVNVKAGEIIIVHLRKKEESAVSELGEELNLSDTKYSSDSARDLWAENENARLGDEQDVILVLNSFNGSVLDAVCYAQEGTESWNNPSMENAALKASEEGKWTGKSVTDAVLVPSITASKSLEKIAADNLPASWSLSGVSPGVVSF